MRGDFKIAQDLAEELGLPPAAARLAQAGNHGDAGFHLTPLVDLLAEPPEETAWVLDRSLPSGGLSLLCAKPKVGKSTLARNLALAVARGDPFLGRATFPGPVIYLALEEKRSQVQACFAGLGATGTEPIHVHVGVAPELALPALEKAMAQLRPALVIVDPLLRFIRVRDANDYAEMTRALEPLLALARLSGAHLLCVHHAGKLDREGGDSILGSTALFGGVDSALIMRRREAGRALESIQRYGDDIPETAIAYDPATGAVTAAGSVAEAELRRAAEKVLEAVGDAALTLGQLREAVEGRTKQVTEAVYQLHREGRLLRSGSGKRGDPYIYSVCAAAPEQPPRVSCFLVPPIYGEQAEQETPAFVEAAAAPGAAPGGSHQGGLGEQETRGGADVLEVA